MSIQPFQPASAGQSAVRFYGPLDPYHYSVDNRPLQDLSANNTALASAVDSGRRSSIIHRIVGNMISGLMFNLQSGQIGAFGLAATPASDGTTTIGTGVILTQRASYDGSGVNITKSAALMAPVQFQTQAPITAGQEVQYLIQVQYTDLSGSNTFPFWDSANVVLPNDLQTGVVTLSIKQGTSAAIGASVTPTVDSGFTALYVVKSTFGVSVPVVTLANGGVVFYSPVTSVGRFNKSLRLNPVTTSTVSLGILTGPQLTKAGTTQAIGVIDHTVRVNDFNLPVSVDMVGAADATGNIRLRVEYSSLVEGTASATTPSWTTLSESVFSATAANTVYRFTAPVTLPVSALDANSIAIRISRISGDITDTNTGNFVVDKVVIHQ